MFCYVFGMFLHVFVKFCYVFAMLCCVFFVLVCFCYLLLCFFYGLICFAMFLQSFAMFCYDLLCFANSLSTPLSTQCRPSPAVLESPMTWVACLKVWFWLLFSLKSLIAKNRYSKTVNNRPGGG